MLSRRLGSLFRGSAAPMQLLLACVVGALIGFVPGAREHPGLLAFHVLLLVVLNANIGLALGVAGLAKLLCLLAMPVSFAVGRWLLEGPARGFFVWAVEAPVLSLLHLDVYAVSGGLLLGLAVGVLAGVMLVGIVQGIRRKLAALEEGSPRYQALMGKGWVRLLLWLLLGKRKQGQRWAEQLGVGFGKPVRIVGVVIVALLGLVVWFSPTLLGRELLGAATRSGLEQAHGATVDVGGVVIDLAQGSLTIDGLAMADPENLGTDLFRALRVEADGSMADLLRARLSLDTLVVREGAQGVLREVPGQLVGERPAPSSAPAAAGGETALESGTLRTWLADAEQLEQRLGQVRRWLDEFDVGGGGDGSGGEPGSEGVPGETLEQRLLREIEALGYHRVRAEGLRRRAPALLVRELLAEGVTTPLLASETLALRGWNLSSDPALVPDSPRLELRSSGGTLALDLGLGGPTRPDADNLVRFALHGVSGDRFGALLGGGRLSGGTLDIDLDGRWDGNRVGWLDLPVAVTLRGCVVDVAGGPRQVDELVLGFHVRGPLDNPRISFDDEQMREALLASARAELQGKVDDVTGEAKARLDEKEQELQDKVDEVLDDKAGDLKDKLGGLLGGKKKKKKDDGR